MNLYTPYVQNIRNILIVVAIAFAIWFFKDWQYQKEENIRQTENARQLRISDSLRLTSQILTTQEMKEYLEYQNKDLQSKLKQSGIKESRLESITTNNYYHKDTTKQSTDVSKLINSIRTGTTDEQSFIDTTKCQTIKGKIIYSGKDLKVQINSREFKNKTDAVVYQERRQWNFLGIKTRFLGKRQFTSKVFDDCGESKILKIEKKK
jgi:hypothetical protein